LHDFAREVLRDQPANIYEYGAAYFKALYMVSNDFFYQLSTPIKYITLSHHGIKSVTSPLFIILKIEF